MGKISDHGLINLAIFAKAKGTFLWLGSLTVMIIGECHDHC